jgi:hypothetical protein
MKVHIVHHLISVRVYDRNVGSTGIIALDEVVGAPLHIEVRCGVSHDRRVHDVSAHNDARRVDVKSLGEAGVLRGRVRDGWWTESVLDNEAR